MDGIAVKAFAKVNMSLEIKTKQPDGYHGIETLFRGIALHDSLYISPNHDGVHLESDQPGLPGLPMDSGNLAWWAARLLRQAFPRRIGGVTIRLNKRIPLSAGLAGGSADAAAALLGINRLFNLRLNESSLLDLAAQLGSDVAFCLEPYAAVGRGRGEVLEPVDPGPPLWLLLVKPVFGMSSKAVYEHWDAMNEKARHEEFGTKKSDKGAGAAGKNGRTGGAEGGGVQKRGINGHSHERAGGDRLAVLLESLRENKPELILENIYNDLEKPAFSLEKKLEDYKKWIEGEAAGIGGASRVMLCGSGSAFAAYFAEEEPARLLEKRLRASLSLIPSRRQSSIPDDEFPLILLTRTLTEEDLSSRTSEHSI